MGSGAQFKTHRGKAAAGDRGKTHGLPTATCQIVERDVLTGAASEMGKRRREEREGKRRERRGVIDGEEKEKGE